MLKYIITINYQTENTGAYFLNYFEIKRQGFQGFD